MDVRIEEGQGNHEDIERRLRHELQRASALGPPARQAAFKRAYRRYHRHRATLGAAAAATVAALLAMAVLVPGRVLTGRAPATALPAAHQPTTASTQSSPPFQEPMTLRASPLQGPPGTRVRVSGTGCVATSGTPKLLMTLMRYHPNGSSDSVAVKPLPLRPDGRWSGTLVVPVGRHPAATSSRPIASWAASVPSTIPRSSGSPQLGPEEILHNRQRQATQSWLHPC